MLCHHLVHERDDFVTEREEGHADRTLACPPDKGIDLRVIEQPLVRLAYRLLRRHPVRMLLGLGLHGMHDLGDLAPCLQLLVEIGYAVGSLEKPAIYRPPSSKPVLLVGFQLL